ncbi:hypothetical protein AVEN_93414-1 [Araneus ventricosus]|uniref:Uncharacterized protein n=1 Tax=Araneus ventricosus TaxID=182803 RepID=A0A4Y2APC7_ARAVE|nr:hypothetical protein AVEN_93414-1 [Araneus ventricosus]
MKRVLSEPATSAAPAKKPSTSDNTDGFTGDSIPLHHYQFGEDNYAVVSDFGDVINIHIRKFRMDENGRIFQPKRVSVFHPLPGRLCRTTYRDLPDPLIRSKSSSSAIPCFSPVHGLKMFLTCHFNDMREKTIFDASFFHLCVYSPKLNGTDFSALGKRLVKAASHYCLENSPRSNLEIQLCRENQPNQLGHECITLNHESRHDFMETLLCSH